MRMTSSRSGGLPLEGRSSLLSSIGKVSAVGEDGIRRQMLSRKSVRFYLVELKLQKVKGEGVLEKRSYSLCKNRMTRCLRVRQTVAAPEWGCTLPYSTHPSSATNHSTLSRRVS